ncbi:MAG: insulinase family protein, partial [Gammaproteobacteria bacterium]|nr:insulinase family protein [Gammaproteobacteria bacterium]
AQNIVLADFWRGLATIDGKARALGRFEVFTGSYENLFLQPEEVRAVSVEEIRAVAKDVFQHRNMTVGVLRSPGNTGETN